MIEDAAFPPAMYLGDPPHLRVAVVTQGLTLYLDKGEVWAAEGAAALLRAFLELAPPSRPLRFTTSTLDRWIVVGDADEVIGNLSLGFTGALRHQFELRVADQAGAAELGFVYREVDDRRTDRSGFVQIHLPASSDPGLLVSLAERAGRDHPIRCGVGGYQVSWSPRHRSTGFWWAYRWCRRYLALDVQDPDRMSWHARSELPGASWLTLLSSSFAKARGVDVIAAQERRWDHAVSVSSLGRSLLFRAGDAPTLGDLNRMSYPKAIAEVSRWLAPHFVTAPQEYLGGFHEDALTLAFLRRFIDPEGWQ